MRQLTGIKIFLQTVMNKISLFTVPHTGTHFVYNFFDLIGVEPDPGTCTKKGAAYYNILHASIPVKEMTQAPRDRYTQHFKRKTIVTARDPYLSTIHHLDLSTTRGVDYVATVWDTFLDILPTINYHIIDIGCKEENRYQHLCSAADFLSLKISYDKDKVKKFADEWQPANYRNNEMKSNYLKSGKLPEGHDWALFDRAVDWYKGLPTNHA